MGSYVGNLENEGVLLAPFHDYEDKLSAEVKTKIEESKQAIVDGTLNPVTGKAN
jgi:basic membrane protein A